MKPLLVLLGAFAISLSITKITRGVYNVPLAGRIAMSVMLVFTAVAHFAFTEGMAMMLPAAIPAKTTIVYLTGVIEILAAVGLLIPATRTLTGLLLILFFILVLPANVYAAIQHVDYQEGTYDGNGPLYLWFRVPLQIFFIGWTYWVAVKR